jgi:flagellar biosynthesis/type III secretory pathway protein FliH
LLKLSGLFSFANSDPNDEQRVQYQNRATNDWAGKLNELLTSLANQKNQNLNTGKQNYQSALAQIAQARAEQQAKTQQLIQQQQQQQYNNRLALLKLMGYGQNVNTGMSDDQAYQEYLRTING